MSDPLWKRFEKEIHAIHAMFAGPDTRVVYDDHAIGYDSKTERQIDVSLRTTISTYPIFIAVECKDKARPIDLPEMGAFASLVHDVKANKGVMVSRSGYSKAAIEFARSSGLDAITYSRE